MDITTTKYIAFTIIELPYRSS